MPAKMRAFGGQSARHMSPQILQLLSVRQHRRNSRRTALGIRNLDHFAVDQNCSPVIYYEALMIDFNPHPIDSESHNRKPRTVAETTANSFNPTGKFFQSHEHVDSKPPNKPFKAEAAMTRIVKIKSVAPPGLTVFVGRRNHTDA